MQQLGYSFNRSEQYLTWPAGSDLPTAQVLVCLLCFKDTLLECVLLGFLSAKLFSNQLTLPVYW